MVTTMEGWISILQLPEIGGKRRHEGEGYRGGRNGVPVHGL